MSVSLYRLAVDLQLTTKAVSREAAVDHAGQIVEQLAIRMARVLTKLGITRHDVEVDYNDISQIGVEPTTVERISTPLFPFRVPLHAKIEMSAESPEHAVSKTQELLAAVPEQMLFVIEKYFVSDLDAQIVQGPTPMGGLSQVPQPKEN